jgi:CRP-like cAMP-binding protein
MTNVTRESIPPPSGDHHLHACHDGLVARQAVFSTVLLSIFRGKFCDVILPNRKVTTFEKNDVIYNVGDRSRMLYFLQSGFVKVGTITSRGHEVIYDVRQQGDVVGELCVSEPERPDRAVALERATAVSVPYDEIKDILIAKPELMGTMIDAFCRALKEAYERINTLATDDTVHRLAKVLSALAHKIGRQSGSLIEIPAYLTQEEIAQMAAARRERISTALNFLRREGAVQYTVHGHLMIDPVKLGAGFID